MHVLLVLFSIDIAKAFSQNRLAYMTVLTISFVVVFVVGFCVRVRFRVRFRIRVN